MVKQGSHLMGHSVAPIESLRQVRIEGNNDVKNQKLKEQVHQSIASRPSKIKSVKIPSV
ncbi:MAG: hypothetical protein AB1589_27485 [Cyanobacteriota bacterium]